MMVLKRLFLLYDMLQQVKMETAADAQFLRALPLKFYANCILQITKSKISDLSEDSHPLRGFDSNDFNLLKYYWR